jgi:hypothetical protein
MQKLAIVGIIVAILCSFVTIGVGCQFFNKTKSQIAEEIVIKYHQEHFYVTDVYDCDNMACDVWDMLIAQNISARIAVNTISATDVYRHAWVLAEVDQEEYLALDATNGQVYFRSDNASYYHGWYFNNPGELKNFLDLNLRASVISNLYETLLYEKNNVEISLNNPTNQNEKDKWMALFNELDQLGRDQLTQLAYLKSEISNLVNTLK